MVRRGAVISTAGRGIPEGWGTRMVGACPLGGGGSVGGGPWCRPVVRGGCPASTGGPAVAGVHEVGLPVAAPVASRRGHGVGVEGPRRGDLPADRDATGSATRRVGAWWSAEHGWADQRWTLARIILGPWS